METESMPDENSAQEPAADEPHPAEPLASTEEGGEPREGEGGDGLEAPQAGAPQDEMSALIAISAQRRFTPAEDDRAIALLSEALRGGRDGVAGAVEQLPLLPWVIGVKAVAAVWPEMKPTMRNRLLAGLARLESEAARRIRLSLARGLFKLDPAIATKLAVTVAKEMREKETAALSARNAQTFANVLIGRAKPWIAQLPLADLKPAEADTLVHAALLAVFQLPHAPLTQLGVVKWASEGGKLGKLHPVVIGAIVQGLTRWNGKWQGTLRREVTDLPEEILSTLKPDAPEEPERGGRRERPRNEDGAGSGPQGETSEAIDEEEGDGEAREQDGPAAPAKLRPVYESKTVPNRERDREGDRPRGDRDRKPPAPANFQLGEALRQIDAHVAALRQELSAAQQKLRQREDDPRRGRKPERGAAPAIPGEPTTEELARLNIQLEARNAELQQRIDDLAGDSEDRAASLELASGTPQTDDDASLRKLLVLKLQDDYEDYLALEQESPDVVVPKHYRTVLQNVFQVLAAEGIFKASEPK